MKSKKHIIFDFDGVIIDSFQTALSVEQITVPELDDETYRILFEGNINKVEGYQNESLKKIKHDEVFWSEYTKRVLRDAQLFPKMQDVITQLSNQYSLSVISSSISSLISDMLSREHLEQYFEEILGNDVHPSKIEKIKMIFDKYDLSPEDCVFVTDTLGDIREGNQVGVGSIGVTWGFHSVEVLAQGNPFRLINHPDQLIETISDYFVVKK